MARSSAAQRTTRSTAEARARQRAEARAEAREARPSLRSVERPPRRVTPTALLVTALTCAVVFGALSVQISLIHRQQRLDAIRSRITAIQLENKELRESESRLQAPAEILRIARDELGMVEARPPELVTPAVETVAASSDPLPTTVPPSDRHDG